LTPTRPNNNTWERIRAAELQPVDNHPQRSSPPTKGKGQREEVMKINHKTVRTAVVAIAAGLATFGGGAVATVPDDGSDLLPEGVYRTRELTPDEVIATGVDAGFDRADVEPHADFDSAVFGLRLADGVWDILQSYDGNFENVGWHGTYEVVDSDTVIATDPGGECSITYSYALNGDQLTIDMVDDPCFPGEVGEQIAQTVIFETAPFILVEPALHEGALPTTEPTAATAPAAKGNTIPDGTYSRVVTRADGEALGLDDEILDAIGIGADGEMPVAIEIANGRWTYYVTNDAGIREPGTGGTYRYDDAGHWVAHEECCDETAAFDWTLAEDVLTLSGAAVDCPCDPNELLVWRFLFEGDYQLQGDDEPAVEAASTVTLRFAGPGQDAPPQLVEFIVGVQELSGGTIEFEWLPAYGAAADPATGGYSNAEDTILTDLASSTIDIGWVGTRALAGFDALQAPLLVDSHDLQERVFEAGIPQRMVDDLDEPGLVGITVLPGPLRRLAGVEHPFSTPADFSGQTIASDNTALAEATFTALGATIVPGREGLPLDDVDAVLAHLGAITGNGYDTEADSVVANVNFWPRPLAIVMSTDSFEALTPEQQDALMTAGANAVDAAMTASRDEDAAPASQLCGAPIDVVEASDSDLAEIAAALEPVYDDLRSDPSTAGYLDEILALKDELGAPPDTLTCPGE
jgi:TRAP-type transport system periplasmic protein